MLAEIRPYVYATEDRELIKLWRKLTISDHFYYMATRFGSVGEVHAYFSPYKNAPLAHSLYIQAVGVLVSLVVERISENPKGALSRLEVAPDKAFYFKLPTGEYTGVSARSLRELLIAIERAPLESTLYHLDRGDIENWLKLVPRADELTFEVARIREEAVSDVEKVERLKRVLKSWVERLFRSS